MLTLNKRLKNFRAKTVYFRILIVYMQTFQPHPKDTFSFQNILLSRRDSRSLNIIPTFFNSPSVLLYRQLGKGRRKQKCGEVSTSFPCRSRVILKSVGAGIRRVLVCWCRAVSRQPLQGNAISGVNNEWGIWGPANASIDIRHTSQHAATF